MCGLLLLGVLVSATLAASPRAAHACSCPDCDLVRDSEVIVAGVITGWTRAAGQPSQSGEVPIDLQIAVTEVWKGAAGSTVTLHDPASLVNLNYAATDAPEKLAWMGGAGGCQAFRSDPAGKFVILGFVRTGETANRVFGPALFFIGAAPEGEQYDHAIARLSANLAPRAPDAGNTRAATASGSGSDDWMYITAIGGGALLFTLVVLLCVGRPR